ncbi:MAG: C40 family peptidase [Bacteroidota bacterium]
MKKAYCIVSISPVRLEASDRSEMTSQLLFGEVVSVEEEQFPWLKIKTYSDNYEGYIDHKHVHYLTDKELNRWLDGITYLTSQTLDLKTPWGKQIIVKGSFVPFHAEGNFNIGMDQFTYTDDYQHDQRTAFQIANDYLNAPYLWGGKSPFGIDCSGLTQQVFRFQDINLPRDAFQQVDYGMNVPFDQAEADDVAFFSNKEGKITHVGIIGPKNAIIHAAGRVRVDQLTREGIVNSETQQLTHTLHSIKRM